MRIFPTKVLLATDGSKDAELATKAAVDLSKRTGAQLHVCHAWRPLPRYAYPSFTPERHHPPYEEGARGLLDEQVGRIEQAGGTVAESHLMIRRPAEAITDLGEDIEAGLIVVGSRGLGPVRLLVVSSVSEGVVHHARCPVLVVRGGEGAWPLRRIVIGDDGSNPSQRAGELAGVIAKILGTEVTLVRAYGNPLWPVGGWSADDRRELDEWLSRESQALEGRERGGGNLWQEAKDQADRYEADARHCAGGRGGRGGDDPHSREQPRAGRGPAAYVGQRLQQGP
jgi:nucleotide-binding universal stress UspA family protein